MYRILSFFLILAVPVLAQEETGVLVYEGTFDDYESPGWWLSGIESVGVFDEFDTWPTPFWELYVAGGTVNDWDEQMGTDWETPPDGPETVWRVQYWVRVVEYAPYRVPTSLQIAQEPWTGPMTTHTIPEEFLNKWVFFDFLMGPEPAFNPEVAPMMGLRFRFGGQQEQIVQLDEIRVYQTDAAGGNNFESRVRGFNAVGATVEGFRTENAPEGTQVLRLTVTDPGTTISDVTVLVARIMDRQLEYTGAYRLNLTMRSSIAPLDVQVGLADSTDVANAKITVVDKPFTLTDKDTWTEVSFLLPPRYPGSRRIQPVIQFGGQGNVIVDIDRLFVFRTEEEVQIPVRVLDWELF